MNGKRETPMVLQAIKVARILPGNPNVHNNLVSILLSIWNHGDDTPEFRRLLETTAETISDGENTAHPSLFRDDYTIVLLALFDLVFSDRQKLLTDDRYCEWMLSYMAFAWKTMASQATVMSIVNTSFQRIAETISDIEASKGLVLIPRPPEVYTAALTAMTACFDRGVTKNSPSSSLSKVEFLPLLLHLILDCIEKAPEESSVVDAAFGLLRVIGTKCTGNDAALILPRVVSVVVKEITGKYGKAPNYKCFVSACKALGAIVPTALDDADLKKEAAEKDMRTDEWVRATSEQFRMAFSGFAVAVRSHSHHAVLDALFDFCIPIMSRCSVSLTSSMGIAIDSVMTILSKREMNSNSDLWSDIHSGTFFAILKQSGLLRNLLMEKVDEWIEGIPQALNSPDEKQALVILRAVEYGMQYARRLKVPMQVLDLRLMESLTEASTIFKADRSTPNVAEFNPRKALAPTGGKFPVQVAPNLSVFGIASQLPQVSETALYQLIYNSSSADESMQRSLLSFSIDTLHNSLDKSRKFGGLWIATTALTGINKSRLQGRDIEEFLNLDMMLVESSSSDLQPLVEDYFGILLDITEQNASNLKQSSLKPIDNATIALALYGLGEVSAYYGEEMKHALPDMISPLIFYLGSSNTGIRQQAQQAISRVAYDCQYENVERLLVDNADYIIDGISLKLNTLDLSPQSAGVLSSLIKLAGPEVVPYMRDVVVTLMTILDNYHGYAVLTEGIFSVFDTLVEEVVKGFAGQLTLKDKEKNGTEIHLTSVEELVRELKYKPDRDQFESIAAEVGAKGSFDEYWENKSKSRDENEAEELNAETETEAKEMDNEEEEEDKKWPSIVPKSTYTTVKKIAEYTDIYLVHESAAMRYNLAKIITSAVPVLATNEKEFLPLVNSYWPVLVSRLDDSEISVLEAVLEAIAQTCEFASEFMTRRVEELWKKLRTLLPQRKGRLPKFSIEMRKMIAALQCLEKIVSHVQLTEEVYGSMLESVVSYLSPKDSDDYRELFLSLRSAFERVNGDYVWFEMMKLGMIGKKLPMPRSRLGLEYVAVT
ncbi:hypothetical protein TRVA0_002S02476 [Trichomonascus vanleenenianus]|uniref:Tti1p n=1 Tax=Trichomonascus vanleenenianus TaxID=2268995 RepID=UPI003ECAD9F4